MIGGKSFQNDCDVLSVECYNGKGYKPVNSNDWKFRELIHTQIVYVIHNFRFLIVYIGWDATLLILRHELPSSQVYIQVVNRSQRNEAHLY